jgi:hypothetical protein
MPRKSPWHSIEQLIHHGNTECNTGNNIAPRNVLEGTGDKPLCEECRRLDLADR